MFKIFRPPKLSRSLGLGLGFAASAMMTTSILCDSIPITRKITVDELQKHKSTDSTWVAINRKVYDLTDFLQKHPGGSAIIMKFAGKDASKLFNHLHPIYVLDQYLEPENYLGELEGEFATEPKAKSEGGVPPLSRVFNLHDFEFISKKVLTPETWAYYSGGSDDEITMRDNHSAFARIFFNPKVLVDVRNVDISTEMMGIETDAPFYLTAVAMAQMGHPDGELSVARACKEENVIQMISSTSSYHFDDITKETTMSKWFQLYVQPDRSHSHQMLKKCENQNVKAVFVTVDTPVLGFREKDFRLRYADVEDDDTTEQFDPIKDYQDPGITWADIDDFKSRTNLPVAIKGVQRVEDVLLAIDHKVDAVVLSNHGGRQLEYSKPPIEVLADVMPILKERKLDDKIDIFIDGGVKRGTDVVKALCLGAKGVGIGRPYIYANSAYGERGVRKAIQLLKNEVILTMKLLGVTKLEDLNEDLIDTRNLKNRRFHNDVHNDIYEPLTFPK
ncbi:cytochrome b2, mitochondrial [[Candida] jaroonii]|uniref:Cytochrome b2, mitochondrial n=1 Tax=[Candida] jaroonii TaxID=467808 RepID=A0ACA9Y976_9ASCO|nr:cytochrome b2, mitochondrial [[Candida] jaroonii]